MSSPLPQLELALANAAAGDEVALMRLYEASRRCLQQGAGVLDVLAAHAEVLRRALDSADDPASVRSVAMHGTRALEEALAPFDMALVGYRDASESLRELTSQLETEIERRTRALQASLRRFEESIEERQRLLVWVVRAQAEERARISADIHDDPVQAMAAATMRVAALRQRLSDDPETALALDQLDEAIRESITRLRRMIFELHPQTLQTQGLTEALRMLLDQYQQQIALDYTVTDETSSRPSEASEAILHRIAVEALANVRKHARASLVRVHFAEDENGFILVVSDDGVGFEPDALTRSRPGHLGLEAMRQHVRLAGGSCKIHSTPGEGTRVEARVPRKESAT